MWLGFSGPVDAQEKKPNVVIIFLDDAGWGDYPPFGTPSYPTPHVAQLAKEGTSYTNFYVPQAICSASRAALMTGCYPGRTRVFGAHGPNKLGLSPEFATMAEVLKPAGYATAVFGKWHLGDTTATHPYSRGFDESAGLMYSNDMWEFHPENPAHWSKFPLQYWEGDQVTIERMTPEHQPHLTTWYTEKAVDFIRRKKDEPFFLYLPHSMPHVPLFVSEKFAGKSGAGLYGDVMMEIDWSVGQVTAALKEAGVEDNTLVVFTSDNGPWTSYGDHAGVTPFREAKGTSFDGGVRSACIIKFPGQVHANETSARAFSSLDMMPTIAKLAGASLPANPVDGTDVWEVIQGKPGAMSTSDYYPFTRSRFFEGVISGDGKWKLHIPHSYRTLDIDNGKDGIPGKYRQEKIGYALFDMENDPFETTDVIGSHPEVAKRLKGFADRHLNQFFPKQVSTN
jgi:arylsulfatase A-like enzyme